ncbi:hypothetical protein DVS77_16955 [Mycolicibacterium moriokaense]|nr:hypothetical protein DVS77_16955 [Mycolicibacterium moriokaense]
MAEERSAEGTVITAAVHSVGRHQDGETVTRMKYVVEYVLDGKRERVELKQSRSWLLEPNMIDVMVGARVPLLVNPRTGRVRFDSRHPSINLKAALKRQKATSDAAFRRSLHG